MDIAWNSMGLHWNIWWMPPVNYHSEHEMKMSHLVRWFTHSRCYFSIAVLNHQKVYHQNGNFHGEDDNPFELVVPMFRQTDTTESSCLLDGERIWNIIFFLARWMATVRIWMVVCYGTSITSPSLADGSCISKNPWGGNSMVEGQCL